MTPRLADIISLLHDKKLYTCSVCGAAVVLIREQFYRSCLCPPDTGIIANCEATVRAVGGLQ